MTYKALIQKFLEMVAKIKNLNPAYKQPGDGSNGVCDCIGLIIGAIRRMGLKWIGIHGSNYAARFQSVNLRYIEKESDLELGDVVLKGVNSDGRGKKPFNKGYFTHKYDLPSRYKKGNSYYTGDLNDYYHAGVVTKVNPLNITHMTSPRMKVDTRCDQMSNSQWNYVMKARPIVDAAGDKPTPTPTPTPAPTPSTGTEAIVVSDNGKPVKMRQYPSTSCATWDNVNVGTKVTIVTPGEDWAKINAGRRNGWYMMSKFLDIIGDGKGKY